MLPGGGVNIKLRKTLVRLPNEIEILMSLMSLGSNSKSICAALVGYPSGIQWWEEKPPFPRQEEVMGPHMERL